MNILVIIQARMGSTRLPGKVLRSVFGKPLLALMLERVKAARSSFSVVVATTVRREDSAIVDLCRQLHVDCFRGDPLDLLDRHYQCARERLAGAVVKIPSDCPLIDPEAIDLVLDHFVTNYPQYDYVSNLHPESYPNGNDVEVMSMAALKHAWRYARKQYEREHTTPYIWDHPNRFSLGNVLMPGGEDHSTSFRWTLDYEEDYQLIREIVMRFGPRNITFSTRDILRLFREYPELGHINARYRGINWYKNYLHELQTVNAGKMKVA